MAEEKAGILHTPEHLKAFAKQLREEADRAEARAKSLAEGKAKVGCAPGCWSILSTCIMIEPL